MSAIIELKYNMVEMITQLEDESSVEELYQIISEFLREKNSPNDLWERLSPEQRADIEQAHEESFDEKNWVPHEEAMKQFKKWLPQ
ncbi:MAG: hypothetical protein OHK0019_32010 [Saprospiraceae bacterium]